MTLTPYILPQNPSPSACERNWPAYDWVMSKKRNLLAPANAENLFYIFHNLRSIPTMLKVDLNDTCLANVEAMLVEHCIDHDRESESFYSCDSSDSNYCRTGKYWISPILSYHNLNFISPSVDTLIAKITGDARYCRQELNHFFNFSFGSQADRVEPEVSL